MKIDMTEEIKPTKATTEHDLMRLCDEYADEIKQNIFTGQMPDIVIRYVVESGKFCYARFGDFFMDDCEDLYVWSRNSLIPAIFAGVKTPYKDVNGESIYTGDVIVMQLKEGGEYTFALGTLGENAEGREARYAFVLDNHCILPEMCKTMKRVGTVFYQIGFNEDYQSIPDLCYRFQPWHGDNVSKEDKLLMARYTPNFDQEMWKYHACQILELEFNWRN